MSNQNLKKKIIGFALTLFIPYAIVLGQTQSDPTPIKAVINYSTAPWDDAAYEILVPMTNISGSPNPFIIIYIWGNPGFQKPKSLQFSKVGDLKEGGRASFQPVLNRSMPITLTGTVVFRALQKGHPVFGTFDFASPDGRTFKASFEATWGNKPLPYIR
jgi:hypothetical protein